MARRPRGGGLLKIALGLLVTSKDADEVRMLLAVVLPLKFGVSIEGTARAIGRSPRWTTDARSRFIRAGGVPEDARRGMSMMRSRAHMTKADEAAFLEPFLESFRLGGALVVGDVQAALEARLGRSVARSTTYNVLHRHGWSKFALGQHHASADPKTRTDSGKNQGSGSGGESRGLGKGGAK